MSRIFGGLIINYIPEDVIVTIPPLHIRNMSKRQWVQAICGYWPGGNKFSGIRYVVISKTRYNHIRRVDPAFPLPKYIYRITRVKW